MSSIDILFASSVINRTSQACLVDLTPPTFAGITGLIANPNGSLTASWSAATDDTLPVRYEVYLLANTSVGLFNSNNLQGIARFGDLNHTIYTTADDSPLEKDVVYYVGVRAVDAVGNTETNTLVLSATSSGIADNALSNKVDELLLRLSTDRADNLDKLDINISSVQQPDFVGALLDSQLRLVGFIKDSNSALVGQILDMEKLYGT